MHYNLMFKMVNTKWKDAIDLEIEQIKEYQVFKDHGKVVYEKGKITNAPKLQGTSKDLSSFCV